MSEVPSRDLIAYRLQQADRASAEAQLLRQGGYLLGAVNRAYYAMFYAIQALLAHRGLKTSTHSGVLSLFDREFVKTAFFDRRFSKWLHELFELRQDADYTDMFLVTEDQTDEALENARTFVSKVKGFLGGGTER